MPCIECGRSFHDLCETNCSTCHGKPTIPAFFEEDEAVELVNYKDPKSAGRKRAAVMYPIVCRNCSNPTTRTRKDEVVCTCGDMRKTDPCEWRGLKNCGGGRDPIVGCLEGQQVDRHHGPNKDTMHNEVGNVHRLCPKCHQRWHHKNDATYNPDDPGSHKPEQATEQEILDNEIYWASRKLRRVVSD